MTALRLGTRGSQLALWQARTVADEIQRHGGPPVDIVVIKTSGDRFAQAALTELGGKRSFVKEIEEALLAGDVDLAVHSAKDLPADLPEGLTLAAVLPREDPRDVVVGPPGVHSPGSDAMALLGAAGPSPRIGTGSVRRIAQLVRVCRGATFLPIRGNLDTRLRKLDEGAYDLLVLAAAGLRRLGFADRISAAIPVDLSVPAPGQGAIAVEARADRPAASEAVARLNDGATMAAVGAERALVAALGGGCQIPLGALATVEPPATLVLRAIVVSLDGTAIVRHDARGPIHDPVRLGADAAQALLASGAGAILDAVRRAETPTAERLT